MTTKEINLTLSRLAATRGVNELFFQYPLPEELARLSCINREAQRAIRRSEAVQRKLLPRRLEHLSPDTTVGEFKRAFIALLNSPDLPRMSDEEVKAAFDHFLDKALDIHAIHNVTEFLTVFDLFVEALTDPRLAQPSPVAVGRFCHYLAANLEHIHPWLMLRVFEKFSPFSTQAEHELKTFLKKQAERHLRIVNQSNYPINGRLVPFILLNEVNSRRWFGLNSSPHSLWGPDRSTPLHPFIHEALWERISSIRQDYPHALISIDMTGKAEARLPLNFTLPLVKQMTDSRIFVDTNDTVRSDTVNPFYCRPFSTVRHQELLSLEGD